MAAEEDVTPVLRPDGWALLEALPPYDPATALALGARLREAGSPAETVAAALTQSRLRAAARSKVGGFADLMLFTPEGLEQATRLPVAARHADRFRRAGATRVVDLGCGIGVDAMAVAGMDLAVDAVERDPATAAVATVNLRHFPRARRAPRRRRRLPRRPARGPARHPRRRGRRLGRPGPAPRRAAAARARAVVPSPVVGARPAGHRASAAWASRSRRASSTPSSAPGGPADGWTAAWTSVDGDVVEAVLWWGAAAEPGRRAARPPCCARCRATGGERRAGAGGRHPHRRRARPARRSARSGRYLHEPDGAVIRAGLVAHVAEQLGGRLLDPMIAYVTTDEPLTSPLARSYAVRAVLPWGLKRLRSHLRAHGRRTGDRQAPGQPDRPRGAASGAAAGRRRRGHRRPHPAGRRARRPRLRPAGLRAGRPLARAAGPQPWTRVTGSDGSVPRSHADGSRPAATSIDPSAATMAPLSVHRPGPRDPDHEPGPLGPLLDQRPQPAVGRHPAAEQQVLDALVAAGGDGLGAEHVDDGLLERGGDVGHGDLAALVLRPLDPPGDRGLEPGEREVVAVVGAVARDRPGAGEPAREADRGRGRRRGRPGRRGGRPGTAARAAGRPCRRPPPPRRRAWSRARRRRR